MSAGRGDVPPSSAATADCSKPADILFLLDDSRSIWGPDFQKMLTFCTAIVAEMSIGPDHTRVAAAGFRLVMSDINS